MRVETERMYLYPLSDEEMRLVIENEGVWKDKNMASSKEYLQFILEQLSDLEEIHYRAMMGEYLTGLFNAMYDELPVHKSNNKKKSLNDQSIIVG